MARIIIDQIDLESAIINYNMENEDVFLLLLLLNGREEYLEKYFQKILEKYPFNSREFDKNMKYFGTMFYNPLYSHTAAFSNNLSWLIKLHNNGFELNIETCNKAAMNGHLSCLKYTHENGCPWNEYTCGVAAENDELECLKYAHENGCSWNEYTCKIAAKNGHLACLKYALDNDCPYDKYIYKNAHPNCKTYLSENGYN